jgi:uncharacterized membrane protein
MKTNRLEAYSDAVLAIIITIMVLELHTPAGAGLEDLREALPVFLAYVLSFLYLSIYWNNHHHLLHATQRVSAGILWGNTHLLFWLSLIPFTTKWMSGHPGEAWPTALYGLNLLLAAVAYSLLTTAIIAREGKNSRLARAIGADFKGYLSLGLYVLGIAAAFWQPVVSYGLFFAVSLIWLIPDKRTERVLGD